MTYAGFWKRFAAVLIDGILSLIVISIIDRFIYGLFGGITEGSIVMVNIVNILLAWLYYALMESSRKQATLGKMALVIFVTDLNGNRISFGKATARHFGKIISSLILGIGYLMAGFTEKKQALHDMLAGCLVLAKG